MIIEKQNEFGRLSIEELRAFEIENNIELPNDYKDFILQYNGGRPIPNLNSQPLTNVAYILGMHNGDYFASLYKHIEMYKTRIPFSTFPIATDFFGNLFLLTMHPESYGQIYFWDHEGEPKIQDGNYVDNCSFVDHSFSDFLQNLK